MEAVLIETPHPDVLAAFYRHGLGLPPRLFGPHHLGFSLPGMYLGLEPSQTDTGAAGRISIWFHVEDINAAFERLLALGAKAKMRPGREGDELMAAVFDPDGNVVGLIQKVGESKL